MSGLPPQVSEVVGRVGGAISNVEPIGGGCIAHASRVEAASGVLFLKWARGEAGRTFEAEAAGLRALRRAGSSLIVPDTLGACDAHEEEAGYLLLEWIEPGRPGRDFDAMLGEGLAELHAFTEAQGRYGFDTDNFIGRLRQRNDWRSDWTAFFREMRLEPHIEIARQSGRWRRSWDALADRLLARLQDLLPDSPAPSICHGDLWSGNVMCASDGRPALIDPATYFGHGETDLAMMTLFGGFDRAVFEAYFKHHSKSPGHADCEAIYQLYHLLSHLNHFGEGYAGGVERVLRRFG